MLSFDFSLEYGGRNAWIDELFIRPELRGKGIGSKALDFAVQAARECGAEVLHLEVNRGNPAIGLYRRHDFADHDRYLLSKWLSADSRENPESERRGRNRQRSAPAAPEEDHSMRKIEQEFGTLNPNAPKELSRFAFLIGMWECEAKVKSANGEWQRFQATWTGHYILDGYAIADEYRMTDSSGKLIVLGLNLRTYDNNKQVWNLKWLNALAGTWTDLGSDELGGVKFDGQSIIYAFKEPLPAHAYTRATYTTASQTCFKWRGEKSEDGKAWSEFMVIEAHRSGSN